MSPTDRTLRPFFHAAVEDAVRATNAGRYLDACAALETLMCELRSRAMRGQPDVEAGRLERLVAEERAREGAT